MNLAADFAAVAELAGQMDSNPDLAGKLAEANPKGFEQVMRVAQFPLVRFQPFGYTIDDNPCQIGFCQSLARQRWGTAGNRGGKTILALMEDAADCLNIDVITKKESQNYKGKISVWVVSDTEDTSVNIVQKTFADDVLGNNQLSFGWEMVKDEVHYSDKGGFRNNWIGFTNGSTIDFKYSSAGRVAFQGTKLHKVHFDEVPPKEIYEECYMRTIDHEGSIIGTCTPIFSRIHGIPWIFKELYVPRVRKKIAFFTWSLFHNPYLPEMAKQDLMEQMEEDEIDARAYGMFTPVGMNLAFGRDTLKDLRTKAKEPDHTGWPRRDGNGRVNVEAAAA